MFHSDFKYRFSSWDTTKWATDTDELAMMIKIDIIDGSAN